jgi:hypothetical protein
MKKAIKILEKLLISLHQQTLKFVKALMSISSILRVEKHHKYQVSIRQLLTKKQESFMHPFTLKKCINIYPLSAKTLL